MTMSFNNHNNQESIPSKMLSANGDFNNHNNKESIESTRNELLINIIIIIKNIITFDSPDPLSVDLLLHHTPL